MDLATEADRREIYRLRHQVYAVELHQHRENDEARLSDPLDSCNTYLKASVDGRLAGFISITPPGGPSYSIDKYFKREEFDFPFDRGLYEVRLLTVMPGYRRRACASLLMYAAFRWVQSLGGTRIVAIGRLDLLELYRKAGLRSLHRRTQSGAVTYELLSATIAELGQRVEEHSGTLRGLELRADWRLGIPFHPPKACSHGGAFFEAIGDEFDHLERSRDVINADVLDAWFPPTPRVLAALDEYLPWLLRTSPPTNSAGMIRAIARARNLPAECIVPGAGSSALIFLCFREWLNRHSRVLLLDPSYGEYGHITDHVLQCKVERLPLDRARAYAVDLAALRGALAGGLRPGGDRQSQQPDGQLRSAPRTGIRPGQDSATDPGVGRRNLSRVCGRGRVAGEFCRSQSERNRLQIHVKGLCAFRDAGGVPVRFGSYCGIAKGNHAALGGQSPGPGGGGECALRSRILRRSLP